MIHGYHVILPSYGFWLPNDPRGSWSAAVRKWELVRFGDTTRHREKRCLAELTPQETAQRSAIRSSLKYPPVTLTQQQAAAVGRGFETAVINSVFTIWSCSILPEHTHLVIARHKYRIEQMAVVLKSAATRQLVKENCHPLRAYAKPGRSPPRMWAEHVWKVYLDCEQAIENAIQYVKENPIKEGRPEQKWKFVSPFTGIPDGWITYE